MGRRLCGEDNYPLPLLVVAGYALPGASRAFPREPLGDESWASVLSAAHTHRLTGLLRAAIDGGALPATEVQAQQAQAAHPRRQGRPPTAIPPQWAGRLAPHRLGQRRAAEHRSEPGSVVDLARSQPEADQRRRRTRFPQDARRIGIDAGQLRGARSRPDV